MTKLRGLLVVCDDFNVYKTYVEREGLDIQHTVYANRRVDVLYRANAYYDYVMLEPLPADFKDIMTLILQQGIAPR